MTARSASDDVVGDAVAVHDGLGEAVVGVHVLAVGRQPRRERVERADLGAGAVGEDLRQPDVVDVLVGDDDPLEVLDRAPVRGQARLQRVSDVPEFGPESTSVSGSSSTR